MKMWQSFLKKQKKEDKLLFKQPVYKVQKEIFLDFWIIPGFVFLMCTILYIISMKRLDDLIMCSLGFISTLGLPISYRLYGCEKFEIYEDKIIVRNALRIRNVTLLKNVKFVEEGKLPLVKGGGPENFVDYYVLNDGRKNKRPGWQHRNVVLNKKKYNLRIYKTEELEAFLRERFEIHQKDLYNEE